jgi:hypothetical protein
MVEISPDCGSGGKKRFLLKGTQCAHGTHTALSISPTGLLLETLVDVLSDTTLLDRETRRISLDTLTTLEGSDMEDPPLKGGTDLLMALASLVDSEHSSRERSQSEIRNETHRATISFQKEPDVHNYLPPLLVPETAHVLVPCLTSSERVATTLILMSTWLNEVVPKSP